MRNIDKWKPTKFVINKYGKLIANPNVVPMSSRFITDLVADVYQKNIMKYSKGKLLDLGCGFVPLYEVYKNNITENVCVDWENSEHKNDFLDMTQDINKKLELEDNEFDTIICSDVLEHIYEPKELFKEMTRVLKKDGVLMLGSPFCYWEHEMPYDYHRYTKYAFRRMCEDNNLEVVDVIPIGDPFGVIVDILSKFAKNKSKFSLMKILIPYFKKQSIKRRKKNKENIQPLSYFLIARKV